MRLPSSPEGFPHSGENLSRICLQKINQGQVLDGFFWQYCGMIKSPKSVLADAPSITSLDELFSIGHTLGQNTVIFCDRLAEEMIACGNDDTGKIFEDLGLRERGRLEIIRQRADQVGADALGTVDGIWHERDLRSVLAREIADNPYLMTPYRALRLAVANKERIFEIITTLVANLNDDNIRPHAEALARLELEEIAELRLRRRRASRSEIKTAIEKAGLDAAPLEIGVYTKIADTVDSIIRQMALSVRTTWGSEMTAQTQVVLEGLLEDFSDTSKIMAADDDGSERTVNVPQDDNNLFSALKTLLRELESAVDLFLSCAEDARSEELVLVTQAKAQRVVHHIAKIRDELNLGLSRE